MKFKIIFPFALSFLLLLASCSKTDSGGGTTPTPVAARTTMDTSYGADAKQKMDIYLPANRTAASTKVIIMIHGGAWIAGDKADYAANIDSLKKRLPTYAIFNINYRLAVPGFPATNVFPTQENDVKAAIDFIYNNRATFLISDKFVLLGASAGGHLSLLQAYKYQTPKIKAVIDYCGPTDMVAMYNDYPPGSANQIGIGLLMSGTPASNPTSYSLSSPITTAYANAANACPTIIFQGTADLTVNANSQSVALKNKLTAAAVPNEYYPYAGLGHVDSWTAPTFTDTYNKIQTFLATYVP